MAALRGRVLRGARDSSGDSNVEELRPQRRSARNVIQTDDAGDKKFLRLKSRKTGKDTTVSTRIDGGIDGGIDGRVDGGIGERANGGISERVDGGIGERIDGGIGERVDGELSEKVDGGMGERIDGGNGERVDGRIGEKVHRGIGERVSERIDGSVKGGIDKMAGDKAVRCLCTSRVKEGEMVCCDVCQGWSHLRCIGIKEGVRVMEGKEFVCHFCLLACLLALQKEARELEKRVAHHQK